MRTTLIGRLWKRLAALTTLCAILGTGCSMDEIQAVVIGIETIAAELDRGTDGEDTAFGEWLLEEIDDL